jgi:uncharacterized protein YlaI
LSALLVLGLGAATPAPAQSLTVDDSAEVGPLDGKALAKARRAADGAAPRELTRALVGAARSEHDERLHRVLGGVDTPDALLAALSRRLTAHLALADGRPGRLAALEGYWAGNRRVEELTKERVEAGTKNFAPADYWAARALRLLAEWRLARALADGGRTLPGAADEAKPLQGKAVARDKRAASRAAPSVPARAALDAAVQEYRARTRRVGSGVDTPDMLLLASLRHVEAGRALAESPADLMRVLESHWQLAWEIEELTRERIEAGTRNFTPADYFEARDQRLEAEAWIAEARRQEGTSLPLKGGLRDPTWEGGDFLGGGAVARAKFAAAQADPRQLLESRRECLRSAYAIRVQRVRGGVDAPDATGEAARRLLAVDLALAGGRAERLAALEAYWARARELDDLTRQRVEAGVKNFTPADFWEARFYRLQAELWLIEAGAAKE